MSFSFRETYYITFTWSQAVAIRKQYGREYSVSNNYSGDELGAINSPLTPTIKKEKRKMTSKELCLSCNFT